MTDRFSNPSGSLGIQRFEVWPAGTDSYNHSELASNWDTLDALLGQPSSGGPWPPTTGLDAGIYGQFLAIQNELLPIGTVAPFFRPSTSVPFPPTGWALMDGSVLSPSEHDFPNVSGNVTLPDLRNSFVLGANPSNAIGQAGVAATSGNIEAAAGAPGPQGAGGVNAWVQTIAQLAAHSHTLNSASSNFLGTGASDVQGGEGNPSYFGGPTTDDAGSGAPIDNRPQYVGLLYICKVLRVA